MELWLILSIVGSSLALIGLSAFVPGVATYVVGIFQALMAVFQRSIDFVQNHLPKPIRMMLFLGLFLVIGASLYTFTVGAPYVCKAETGSCSVNNEDNVVCSDGEVVKVGYMEGLAYRFLPQNSDKLASIWKEQAEGRALADSEYTSPLTVTGTDQINGSSLFAKNIIEWPAGSGYNYETTYALMAYFDEVVRVGTPDLYSTAAYRVWDRWSGGQQQITYSLCSESLDGPLDDESINEFIRGVGDVNVCVLKRAEDCSAGLGGTTIGQDHFNTFLGHISYRYVPSQNDPSSGVIIGRFTSRASLSWFKSNLVRNPSICSVVSEGQYETLKNSFIDQAGSEAAFWSTIITSGYVSNINLVDERDVAYDYSGAGVPIATGLNVYSDVPIYYTEQAAIFYEPISDKVYQDGSLTIDGTKPIAFEPGELIKGGEVVDFSDNPVFAITCNFETEDIYDTKPLVFGLDLLDFKTMLFIVLISGILGAYSWWASLWR